MLNDFKVRIINNDIKDIFNELVYDPAPLDEKCILNKIYVSDRFYYFHLNRHILKNSKYVDLAESNKSEILHEE